MTTFTELNQTQSCIYSRSNLCRAFPGFDDTDIAGIYLHSDNLVVVRNDGNEELYDPKKVQQSFMDFNRRLTDFFSFLGPNYRSPSVWHHNGYILFKGWHYNHQLGKNTQAAQLQRAWADKFIHLNKVEKLTALLQSDQTNLGYLIAPDGLRTEDHPINMMINWWKDPVIPIQFNIGLSAHVGRFNVNLIIFRSSPRRLKDSRLGANTLLGSINAESFKSNVQN